MMNATRLQIRYSRCSCMQAVFVQIEQGEFDTFIDITIRQIKSGSDTYVKMASSKVFFEKRQQKLAG